MKKSGKKINVKSRLGVISALEWGEPASPPIVALHGWLDNAASFEPLARELSEYRVIALDFHGHGDSSHSDGFYPFSDWVFDVLEVKKNLGLGPCILMGHSLGGAVATLVGASLPGEVLKIVSLDALGPIPMNDADSLSRLRRFVSRGVKPPMWKIYPSIEEAISARMTAASMNEASARLICNYGLKKVKEGFVWKADPKLKLPSAIRWNEKQIEVILGAIECPVLVIETNADFENYKAQFKNRLARLKQGRRVQMEGTHHVHMDDPKRVAEAIRQFLKS